LVVLKEDEMVDLKAEEWVKQMVGQMVCQLVGRKDFRWVAEWVEMMD